MGLNTALIFMVFSFLVLLRLKNNHSRNISFSRSKEEWIADFVGLFVQGVIIPLLPLLMMPIFKYFVPHFYQSVQINPLIQFTLSFFVVDYLYYWNHRFFHSKTFWHIHRLHHSSRHLDVFATSRNSLVTSFVFVYVWAQGIGLYLIKDPNYFLAGFGCTFALDLWRHGGVATPNFLKHLLSPILILPEHHVFHHAVLGRTKNYGANLNWWDKIHGTFSAEMILNENLEKLPHSNIWSEIFSPRRIGK